MPNVMIDYDHLNSWDEPRLLARQQLLKESAPITELSDEALQELLAIMRVLRRRTVAPTARSTSTKRAPAPSLDSL